MITVKKFSAFKIFLIVLFCWVVNSPLYSKAATFPPVLHREKNLQTPSLIDCFNVQSTDFINAACCDVANSIPFDRINPPFGIQFVPLCLYNLFILLSICNSVFIFSPHFYNKPNQYNRQQTNIKPCFIIHFALLQIYSILDAKKNIELLAYFAANFSSEV